MKDDIIKKQESSPYEEIIEFSEETLEGIRDLFYLIRRVHFRMKKQGLEVRDGKVQPIIKKKNENNNQ